MSPEPSPLDPASLPESYRPFAAALTQCPDPALEFVRLLDLLGAKAPQQESIRFARILRDAWPEHPIVRSATSEFLGNRVPRYHLPMIADQARNDGYATAIAACVRPGMTILEIGTGSGLLAMLAARTSAEHVYTVEANPVMAAIARRNIALNGLEDRVTVIDGLSTSLRVGPDLPARADMLIHELFDAPLVGEDVINIVADARARLLAPDALLLPFEARLRGRIVETDMMSANHEFSSVCGLDLSALHLLRRDYELVSWKAEPTFLSPPSELARLDLGTVESGLRNRTEVGVPISADGTARGVLQWIGYAFPDGTVFENAPGTKSVWSPVFHRFLTPRAVRAGETRTLSVTIAERRLALELD